MSQSVGRQRLLLAITGRPSPVRLDHPRQVPAANTLFGVGRAYLELGSGDLPCPPAELVPKTAPISLKSSTCCGKRRPCTPMSAKPRSISSMSAPVNRTAQAPKFSSKCFRLVVPGIGAIHGLRACSHASETWPGVASCRPQLCAAVLRSVGLRGSCLG
jgi:hypothetical protein